MKCSLLNLHFAKHQRKKRPDRLVRSGLNITKTPRFVTNYSQNEVFSLVLCKDKEYNDRNDQADRTNDKNDFRVLIKAEACALGLDYLRL